MAGQVAADHAPLDVRGVTKSFRRRQPRQRRRTRQTAVRDVSFRVGPGEIYGVIGSNGSGKSTLVRMLSTLLLPDAGETRVFGRDAVRSPGSVRSLLNRVSADASFFRAMSATENHLFHGRVYGMSGQDVREQLARC
jgi:ABC-2 type transport system ATP-binding protein